jgi:hypothetical protein
MLGFSVKGSLVRKQREGEVGLRVDLSHLCND